MPIGDAKLLVVGTVVKSGGRLWRIGLVNLSRARLDPLTGIAVVADPSSGRSFQSYGGSINISSTALMEEVDIGDLDEQTLGRLVRLQSAAELEEVQAQFRAPRRRDENRRPVADDDDEDDMAEAVNVGAVATDGGKPTKAQLNAARLAQIKANRAEDKAKREARTVKRAAEGKSKGPVSRDNDCQCGCGGKTSKYFVPGHDARFKGWLLKIERGESKPEDLMPKATAAKYTWRNKGKGKIPTKLWNGESHTGFIAD